MNIIYMHTHDLGRYIGPHGYPVKTPNMQRLAEEGVLFRNAFCMAPTCSPSRAATVTGRYPHQVGMHGLVNQGWRLNDYSQHFAGYFSQRGVHTALTGVQHVTGWTPEQLADLQYDEMIEPCGEAAEITHDRNTEVAIDFLRRDHDKPFFLNVGYALTHHSNWDRSYVLSRESMGPLDWRFVKPLPHLPDTPRTRWEAAMQYRATEYFDTRLGMLLDALDETGLAEDTLLLFTTDHGPGLPGVKVNLNDQGLGVTMLARGPGGFGGGQVIEALTTHMDLYPTFCEAYGFEKPGWLEGKALQPLVNGEVEQLHEMVFAEQGYHGKYVPLRSVRTPRYRYTRCLLADEPRLGFLADGGEAMQLLYELDYDRHIMPGEQMFDVTCDPMEQTNLVNDPQCAAVLNELRAAMDEHLARTADPALEDAIPEPPGVPEWAVKKRDKKLERVDFWRNQRLALQAADGERFAYQGLPADASGTMAN